MGRLEGWDKIVDNRHKVMWEMRGAPLKVWIEKVSWDLRTPWHVYVEDSGKQVKLREFTNKKAAYSAAVQFIRQNIRSYKRRLSHLRRWIYNILVENCYGLDKESTVACREVAWGVAGDIISGAPVKKTLKRWGLTKSEINAIKRELKKWGIISRPY